MLIVGPGSVGEAIRLMPGPLLNTADLLAALASLRPRSGDTVGYAIPMALRDWGAGPSSSMASSNGWRC